MIQLKSRKKVMKIGDKSYYAFRVSCDEITCSNAIAVKSPMYEEIATIQKETAWLATGNNQKCPSCYPCVFTT